MCGRYAASRNPDDLIEEFEVQEVAEGARVPPVFNVAPTVTTAVVLERVPKETPDGAPVRWLRPLVWGLVPSWAKDRAIGNRMINARSETMLEAAAYRRAAAARRCLVPADGWYEWQVSPVATDSRGRPRKQPFFIRLADRPTLAFAGLYEFWRDPRADPEDPDAWLTSYAIITTDAEPGLDRIHDRMPLVLPPDRWSEWLSPAVQDEDDVRAMLQPPEPGRFTAYPVTTRVNDVRNDGPDLVSPAAEEDLVGVVDPRTGEVIGGQREQLF